jgi:hypothetical protein
VIPDCLKSDKQISLIVSGYAVHGHVQKYVSEAASGDGERRPDETKMILLNGSKGGIPTVRQLLLAKASHPEAVDSSEPFVGEYVA